MVAFRPAPPRRQQGGGNLHFAMLADAMHYHATHQLSYADLLNAAYSSFNITHRVHAFAVGAKLPVGHIYTCIIYYICA